jgi:galactokinase
VSRGRLLAWLGEVGHDGEAAARRTAVLDPWLGRSPLALEGRRAFYVPGRIEIFGKHTDYAGGRSLVCATTRALWGVVTPRADGRIRITDARNGEVLELAGGEAPPRGGWRVYPATVWTRLGRDFPDWQRGAEVVFASDIPRAAGVSSSSALVVATYLALASINQRRTEPHFPPGGLAEAEYAACLENGADFGALRGDRGVGTASGAQDHLAILASAAGEVRQFAFLPARLEVTISFRADWVFVVATSGVRAEKTGGAQAVYNAVAERASALVQGWRRTSGERGPTSLGRVLSTAGGLEEIRRVARDSDLRGDGLRLADRLEQFRLEAFELVPAAAEALAKGEGRALGELARQSMAAAQVGLGNQTPETLGLVDAALAEGALAASAFGAGFGGSVWALVPKREEAGFRSRWRSSYERRFPQRAGEVLTFATPPGPCAAVSDSLD